VCDKLKEWAKLVRADQSKDFIWYDLPVEGDRLAAIHDSHGWYTVVHLNGEHHITEYHKNVESVISYGTSIVNDYSELTL
jgi:hypothetical protein